MIGGGSGTEGIDVGTGGTQGIDGGFDAEEEGLLGGLQCFDLAQAAYFSLELLFGFSNMVS